MIYGILEYGEGISIIDNIKYIHQLDKLPELSKKDQERYLESLIKVGKDGYSFFYVQYTVGHYIIVDPSITPNYLKFAYLGANVLNDFLKNIRRDYRINDILKNNI